MKIDFEEQRKQLVELMNSTQVIQSENVKTAFLNVKRELFIPEQLQADAYYDGALPLGFGQTISQPSTIAIMLEMLKVEKGFKVLEVGSGCGYVTALLSELVGLEGKVFGMEIVPELVEISKKNLEKQGVKNVSIIQGDGSKGLQEKAPFERILISSASPFIPKPLLEQLSEKGICVAPIGDESSQEMISIIKSKNELIQEKYPFSAFVFVPLKGEHGFK